MPDDEGFVIAVLPLIVAVLLGIVVAVVGSVALVSSQSASGTVVDAPLVTYDAR